MRPPLEVIRELLDAPKVIKVIVLANGTTLTLLKK